MFFNVYPYLNVNDLNLDWIIKHFKEFIDEISALDAWRSEHEKEYLELKKLYDGLVSGNFPPAMENSLKMWIVANSSSLLAELAKVVFFGITDDGYFYADIPESWSEIIFNTTGYDITIPGEEYGKLVLTY